MLKKLLVLLLCVWCGAACVFGQGYYITEEQMDVLVTEVANMSNSNNNLQKLLQKQKLNFMTVSDSWNKKYILVQQQLENCKRCLARSENKKLIYKYGVAIAFVVGVALGVIIVK